ncbi:alanine--tRNA ligase [Buchnera aphidicola]|uniref:alanine--tRNA ligase n=1 Tax=Buchnera aphidicola TaxID=9 RepID=UPI00094C4BFB|nr:alanine--tRNA ligase [Buchnera aphidicola]
MKTDELRTMFLRFFQEKNHKIIPSSSLAAQDNDTLLFTNAGMNQFKKIYLGYKKNHQPSMTSAQYCVRTGGKHDDLKKVGYTPYHHTLFEMLGNFSFGEYFKEKAITYAWEFLTHKKWLHLSKKKIWITYYYNDEETKKIWLDVISLPPNRLIAIYDKDKIENNSDNFWNMGDSGPCGPCTEIFYEQNLKKETKPFIMNARKLKKYCVEIWNLVFMQFNQIEPGKIVKLPIPSIDTGMGLERIAAILQKVKSSYEIDTFVDLIEIIKKKLNIKKNNKTTLRVISDHIRASTCMIAENIRPGNEGRGYVLRRIIRRALCHGYFAGLHYPFFYKLSTAVMHSMQKINTDFNIYKKIDIIKKILFSEEHQFHLTLKNGINRLGEEIKKNKNNELYANQILYLYDTFGLPIEITQDICKEKNIFIDVNQLNKILNLKKRKEKKNIKNSSLMFITKKSIFDGYHEYTQPSKIIQIISNNKKTDQLSIGQNGILVLEITPFYGESSGQIGDSGEIISNNGAFIVTNTQRYGYYIAHIGFMKCGTMFVHDIIMANINVKKRKKIQSNHTATHLLNSALRNKFGVNIRQKGSFISDKYLRFDFNCEESITEQDIGDLEKEVNDKIHKTMFINTLYTSFEKAKKYNAIFLKKRKYKNTVRIVDINNYSIEMCNGTHHTNTGKIGCFKIISYASIGNKIKRIIAITGLQVIKFLEKKIKQEKKIEGLLKTKENNTYKVVKKLFTKINKINQENIKLKNTNTIHIAKHLIPKANVINQISLIIQPIDQTNQKILRNISDIIKKELQHTVIILISNNTLNNQKITFFISVTKNITNSLNALDIMNIIFFTLPGKGGGKKNMAAGKLTQTRITLKKIKELECKIIKYIKRKTANKSL